MDWNHTDSPLPRAVPLRGRPALALVTGVAVGVVGGLLGLGGAEFRLPVLVAVFGYAARRAAVLNLTVSLVTVMTAATTRLLTASAPAPWTHVGSATVGMMLGGMLGAYTAAAWLAKISEVGLHRLIRTLLLGLGILLMTEAVVPRTAAAIAMDSLGQALLGSLAGLIIGAVSSILGVAGGELIIPVLVFAFGVSVKAAGTLSLLISLPTILVGLWRHTSRGIALAPGDLSALVVPMAIGSIVGATVGALLVAYVPSSLITFLLGLVLIASALKVFSPTNRPPPNG